ncbi:MAG: spermidine/putrescine ABC transporter substrate-binding protein [Hyphomicrobiales bacterium]|nr:extracellular solute-binding protein [Hyphomicrobiales bacterium]PCJ88498.1 MAG: spermidine/putrescine ABC transporter substrate-binding protein [Hyphomicrobiales bacterium]
MAAHSFSRRSLLKGAAATGAIAASGVFSISQSLASSGEVNVFAWGDYIKDNISDAFEKKTGIKINLSTFGSNEELQSKLKASGGKGFDLVFPSVDTRPEFDDGDLLAEIDESRVNVDQIEPAVWRSSLSLGAARRGKRHLVPFDWGTEGVTYDSSVHSFEPGELSYGHMWADGLDGKVAGRQKSLVMTLAIYLDSIGEVSSNRGMDIYKSEADMRRVMDGCLAFMAPHKKNIGAFWNNATEATSAFTDSGCTIGQTWDTTGIKLHNDVDKKWIYTAPKEGALGWMDTMAIPSGAENVEQSYELMNFLMTPEIGGMFANNTGYNSAAVGSSAHLSDESKEAFNIAYPAGAIENLWWWPMSTPWFSNVRQEYVEKMTAL